MKSVKCLLSLVCVMVGLIIEAESLLAEDSRMIAYLGNWQSCPKSTQLAQYTHIVIAFAVSYTWSASKNICSSTCQISTPPICANMPNSKLISDLHASGKKIILSFGGAGMGGSWAGDVNNCWEYCFGREQDVVNQLVRIVTELNLDGVDLDYEYFYADNQNGSGFARGAEAIKFLREVTLGLRNKLPAGAIVSHAPMDSDLVESSAYFNLLKSIGYTLDFLMPQYYNGITRPAIDGFLNSGVGTMSAANHYATLVRNLFAGDTTRIVFGFCISDCSYTGSNANAAQAAKVMNDVGSRYSCHGGAFFWVAEHDTSGLWSATVNKAMEARKGCSGSISRVPDVPSNTTHPTLSPVTHSPSNGDQPWTAVQCCPEGFTGLRPFDSCTKFYHCSNGKVLDGLTACPTGLLFDEIRQICNWAYTVSKCTVDRCGAATQVVTQGHLTQPPATKVTTKSPMTSLPITKKPGTDTKMPTPVPSQPTSDKCCAKGVTALRPSDNCSAFYHCVNGAVVGDSIFCAPGLLFDENLQVCNWAANVKGCSIDSCSGQVSTSDPKVQSCCSDGFTGLRPINHCSSFYHCVNGLKVGNSIPCGPGLLFDEKLQVCNWASAVQNCAMDQCNALDETSTTKAPVIPTAQTAAPTSPRVHPESPCNRDCSALFGLFPGFTMHRLNSNGQCKQTCSLTVSRGKSKGYDCGKC